MTDLAAMRERARAPWYEDAAGHVQTRARSEILAAFKRAMFERAPLFEHIRTTIRRELAAELL